MGLLNRIRGKEIPASIVGETLALGFWREWDDPARLRSFCDNLNLNVRSDRILLVLGAQKLFSLVFVHGLGRLGLEPQTAQVVLNQFAKHLALMGAARGYWDDPAAALDTMSDLGRRLSGVWTASAQKPPNPAWYVSKAMVEAVTGAPLDETDPKPTMMMHAHAYPDAAGLAALFDKLRLTSSALEAARLSRVERARPIGAPTA